VTLCKSLCKTKVKDWCTHLAIVFDWDNGPKQGICQLAHPKCEFVYDLLAARSNPNGLDDRLFRLRGVQIGTIDKIASLLSIIGPPSSPVWIPIWRFPSDNYKKAVDSEIDALLSKSSETGIVIWTQNMQKYLGCWCESTVQPVDLDWFTHFDI
jgi:hypothetical protein